MTDQIILQRPPKYTSIVAPPAYSPSQQQQQQHEHHRTAAALTSSLVHIKRKSGATSSSMSSSSSSTGAKMDLTSSRKKNAIELHMTLSDNLLFVYPNDGQRVPSTDDTSSGGEDEGTSRLAKKAYLVVSLTLSVAAGCTALSSAGTRIAALTVELLAQESLGFPDAPFEYNSLTLATQSVEEARASVVEAGQTYHFQTLLEVPHNVVPYECSRYGRLLPRVRAKLEWEHAGSGAAAMTTTTETKQPAWKRLTNLTGGLKSLKAEQDVWIMAVPRTSNVLDYARTHRSFVENLGPIVMHTRTQHLTVGGYLRMGLCLPAPAPGCVVERISMALVQSTKLKSRRSRRGAAPHVCDCEPDRIPFFTIEGEELKQCLRSSQDANGATVTNVLRGDWVARLPSDRYARPSTLQGSTEASLRISHQLEVRIFFKAAPSSSVSESSSNAHTTVYSAAWPLTLASCACRWRSLKLPTYSERDPCPMQGDAEAVVADVTHVDRRGGANSTARRTHQQPCDQSDCTCGIALEELLRYEREQDAEQQASTIALMRQEIELATSGTSSSSSSSGASIRSRSSSDAAVAAAYEQRGRAAARAQQGSAIALHPACSIDDQDALAAATLSAGGSGPGGLDAWAQTEENERRRVLIEQKAAQEYQRSSSISSSD